MDDGKLAVLADVGVGVDVVRRAVGRPAGMAHADGALHIRAAVDEVAQGFEPAHGFFDLKLMPRRNDRDTGAVVAAVFQTGQAVEQNGGSLLAADVSNNTTHKKFSFMITKVSAERRAPPQGAIRPARSKGETHRDFTFSVPSQSLCSAVARVFVGCVRAGTARGGIRRKIRSPPASSSSAREAHGALSVLSRKLLSLSVL